MVGTSKVLTVSYGTFSCTLEGFDEPFSTMKAIVEYFRELAETDPHFGAELPAPDAERLHRIAESGSGRRVEADVGESGIVLRALAERKTEAKARPVPADAAAKADPESIEAKLGRIRALIAAAPDAVAAAQTGFEEDEPASEFSAPDLGFAPDPDDSASDPRDVTPTAATDAADAEAGDALDLGDWRTDAPPAAEAAEPAGALDLGAWRTDDPPPAAAEDEAPQPMKLSYFDRARARVSDIRQTQDAGAETAADDDEFSKAISAAMAGGFEPVEGKAVQKKEGGDVEDNDAPKAGTGTETGKGVVHELSAAPREVRRDAHEGRAILASTSRDEEASVKRLMEEARTKLEGDESRRRFSAISHLKAAVAATVADRKVKASAAPSDTPAEGPTDLDRYREDLSKAVRPRKLGAVLFKRKDDDDGIDDGEISPEDARNFAEFAERLGARGLPELLEAAAAYAATVEGQPHFSRPHILRKVANVADNEEYSREDRLRTFGLLLREGKLQKISRGQFTITNASRFMSESRTASR